MPGTSCIGSTTKRRTASWIRSQTHTNNAEGFFSRMRRGEIGHHHHVAGPYLLRFAQEAAWREDHKREANGSQVDRIVALSMNHAEVRRFLWLLAEAYREA